MCCCYILDNKEVTILSTLGRLDFYNQIVLQSMSTLHVQLLCDILLDIMSVLIFIEFISTHRSTLYCEHCIYFTVLGTGGSNPQVKKLDNFKISEDYFCNSLLLVT